MKGFFFLSHTEVTLWRAHKHRSAPSRRTAPFWFSSCQSCDTYRQTCVSLLRPPSQTRRNIHMSLVGSFWRLRRTHILRLLQMDQEQERGGHVTWSLCFPSVPSCRRWALLAEQWSHERNKLEGKSVSTISPVRMIIQRKYFILVIIHL